MAQARPAFARRSTQTSGASTTTTTLLLFDLGGVLVQNSGLERLAELLPYSLCPNEVKSKRLMSQAVKRFEVGQIRANEFAAEFMKEWSLQGDAEGFLAEFESWPKGFFAGTEEFLLELRKKIRVACLSNSNEVHWKKFDGFRSHFDVNLSSHLLGVIKPMPECFECALLECGATAEQTVFFDDIEENVEAARRCGIRSCHVNGLNEVREAVHCLGLHKDA